MVIKMPESEKSIPINCEEGTRLRVENSPLRFFTLRTLRGSGLGSSSNTLRREGVDDKVVNPTHPHQHSSEE